MDIESRIADVEQKFNTKQGERDELLKQAEECLVEMNKLQGAYRLLQDLKAEEPTVEAVNEGKPKKKAGK